MAVAKGDVGMAFLLTTIAGLATALGACLVFFAKLANRMLLAVSLGVAAGVMLFISFFELLSVNSINAFLQEGVEPKYANLYALSSFFGGILLLRAIDEGLHILADMAGGHKRPAGVPSLSAAHGHGTSLPEWMLSNDEKATMLEMARIQESLVRQTGTDLERGEVPAPAVHDDPSLPKLKTAEAATKRNNFTPSFAPPPPPPPSPPPPTTTTTTTTPPPPPPSASSATATAPAGPDAAAAVCPGSATPAAGAAKQAAKLLRTGLLTAIVIAVHNFPEGVATFVSSLKDTRLGASMCFAIALHNIPEGVCISMPVFYATGSKKKAFFWAFLSGAAEPFGAVLAYAALAHAMNNISFGILFGGTAGIMVSIVLAELLPTARKYDPEDKAVTHSLFVGMLVMALSIVLFDF